MKETPEVSSEVWLEDKANEPGFHDWARFVSFQPQLYFRPQNLNLLKSFLEGIQQGTFKPGSLRVLGGLHSCSEICVSDAIIDTSDLPRMIEFAPGNSAVTVTANWHLHDFLLALSQRGKSISATGGTDKQTLAHSNSGRLQHHWRRHSPRWQSRNRNSQRKRRGHIHAVQQARRSQVARNAPREDSEG